jgi:hypothetical protein
MVTMPAQPGAAPAPPPFLTASVPPADPFARETPLPLSFGYGARAAFGTRRTASGRLHALPPLVAVPNADNGPLPPAPVVVEANAPIPQNADVARHTVVVHRLSGLSEFAPPGAGDQGGDAAGDQGSPPEPQSRIQITVDPSTSGNASAGPAVGGGSSGEADQQSAFALQQQGRYSQAAALYGRAIAAYQAQIASGQDVDAAQRGLQACQTGLQICRQSQ